MRLFAFGALLAAALHATARPIVAPCPGFAYQQLAVCIFACNPSPAYLPPPLCATPPGGGATPCDCWDPCWQRFLRECPGKG